jgi:DNA polymerase I-like protein with 3'-5' exonuclease and polymerase domains
VRNYGLVTSLGELVDLCNRLAEGQGPVGFDIETGYLGPDREKFAVHPETAIVVGISITDSTEWARYIPLAHDNFDNVDEYTAARLLWPILHSGRGIAHNASFELRHLSRWFLRLLADDPEHGPAVRASKGYYPVRSDTQVEAYLAAEHPSFGLKFLVKQIFDHQMTELWELFVDLPVNKRKYLRFNVLDPADPKVYEYACEDSLWALALHRRYHPRVSAMPLYGVEMAVITECTVHMEDFGVRYDWAAMRRTADELRLFRDKYNREIMDELSGLLDKPVAINLASPPQVGKLLFGDLGLRTSVYTSTTRDKPAAERKMSTGKTALAGLAKQHPVVQKIRTWKELTRLLTTYLDKYERLYQWADDGMTHPNHMSAVVITGRFAVADPPYQQSPKEYHVDLAEGAAAHRRHVEEHGKDCGCDVPGSAFSAPPGTCFKINFRDFIIAPDEHYIVGFDFSQQELRAIAGEAQETELLRAFDEGRDVHTLTASLMLGVPLHEVTKEQRNIGKTLGFALLYGMSAKGLADRLGIGQDEAEDLFNSYFRVFSRIKAWVDKQVAFGRSHGYVVSKFGRRLPIWEYQSDKRWIQQKGDRTCVNYPIQGSATGDTVKIAMVRAVRALKKAGLADRVHLVMNVHDALEFYVHRSLEPAQVIAVLQPAVVFPVPGWPALKADWHFALRWGSPVEITVTDAAGITSVAVDTAREPELKPGVEVDEDTGEEVEILPALAPADIQAALRRGDTGSGTGTGRHLLVELDTMPTLDGYQRFLELVTMTPGPNTVTIRTDDGDLDLDQRTGLGIEHVAPITLLLGPVRLRYDLDEAGTDTLDSVLDGVSL